MEWNSGMEWNDHVYMTVNGHFDWCAHAQQIDDWLFSLHTKEEANDGSTNGQNGGLAVGTL